MRLSSMLVGLVVALVAGVLGITKVAVTAAEIAKNQDYVKMNKESIAEWSKK